MRITLDDQPFQLSLDLPVVAGYGRDDLVVSDANRLAVNFLEAWPAWPGPVAILAGPVGAGKTHLARVWAERSGAQFLQTRFDGEQDVPPPGHYVVEDVRQGGFSETWLFHLINTVRAGGHSLLLTSRRWPGDWGIALPDLRSRMKLAQLMELNEPDDTLLSGVLMKLFADRQLPVDKPVVDYLALRMERSLGAAQTLVAELDRLSLETKKPITRNLASQALRMMGLPV
ncbi:MAG: hypothetical protein AAFO61_09270 [Pseudomonadota bacterium]